MMPQSPTSEPISPVLCDIFNPGGIPAGNKVLMRVFSMIANILWRLCAESKSPLSTRASSCTRSYGLVLLVPSRSGSQLHMYVLCNPQNAKSRLQASFPPTLSIIKLVAVLSEKIIMVSIASFNETFEPTGLHCKKPEPPPMRSDLKVKISSGSTSPLSIAARSLTSTGTFIMEAAANDSYPFTFAKLPVDGSIANAPRCKFGLSESNLICS